jgi:hypothetical protein
LPDKVLLHSSSETFKALRKLLRRTLEALAGHDELPSGLTSTFLVEEPLSK